MLFTVAQPLSLVVEGSRVLGAFVGLVTLDCIDPPKRFTRSGNTINAEQYCLYHRLCSLHFSELSDYRTFFVAANGYSVTAQFIWAQMTIGKNGYTGCSKLPVFDLMTVADFKPMNYAIHEIASSAVNTNMCVIKFPHMSLFTGACVFASTPTNMIDEYCKNIESLSVANAQHTPKTIYEGIKIGEETHTIAPFEISVTYESGVSRYLCVNARTSDREYLSDLIIGALKTYDDCLRGAENDKLDALAFKYGRTDMGYCTAVYIQLGIFLVPIESRASLSFDLTKTV